MFFEVLGPTYHSPITIEPITYRVSLGTLGYSAGPHVGDGWRTCGLGQTNYRVTAVS